MKGAKYSKFKNSATIVTLTLIRSRSFIFAVTKGPFPGIPRCHLSAVVTKGAKIRKIQKVVPYTDYSVTGGGESESEVHFEIRAQGKKSGQSKTWPWTTF